jgi:hypothetical protein
MRCAIFILDIRIDPNILVVFNDASYWIVYFYSHCVRKKPTLKILKSVEEKMCYGPPSTSSFKTEIMECFDNNDLDRLGELFLSRPAIYKYFLG